MTDELPEIFDHLQPPPAPPQLRPLVFAAVERELTRRKKPRWERAFELSVAACLAVGVGWNVLQWRADERWRSQIDRTSLAAEGRQDLVDAVASITDHATAQMLVDRLVSTRLGRRGADRPMPNDPNDATEN